MTNDEIVTAFIHEWDNPNPDPQRLIAYFADAAVYHNMPMAPAAGRDAILKTFEGMTSRLTSLGWETKWQLADGDRVVNERIDRFTSGEKRVELPVVGVFELKDGKITAWRDYFDLGTWQRALA